MVLLAYNLISILIIIFLYELPTLLDSRDEIVDNVFYAERRSSTRRMVGGYYLIFTFIALIFNPVGTAYAGIILMMSVIGAFVMMDKTFMVSIRGYWYTKIDAVLSIIVLLIMFVVLIRDYEMFNS